MVVHPSRDTKLTVGELRALIADLPDNMGVCAISRGYYRVKTSVDFYVAEVDQRRCNEGHKDDEFVLSDDFPGRTLVVSTY